MISGISPDAVCVEDTSYWPSAWSYVATEDALLPSLWYGPPVPVARYRSAEGVLQGAMLFFSSSLHMRGEG